MILNILLFILAALRLWIGMRLFSTAHNNRRNNLYWLALLSFCSAITVPFLRSPGNPLASTPASPWLGLGLNVPLIQFPLILFIHTTFYSDRKSPADWFAGITAVGVVVLWYGIAISPLDKPHSLTAVSGIILTINWTWQAWEGYTAWRNVAHERSVEDWVKTRYKLIVWYSVFQVVTSLSLFVVLGLNVQGPLMIALSVIALVSNIAGVALQYFAWAAPQGYYRWLNRRYQPPKYEEMTEEQVMGQLAV